MTNEETVRIYLKEQLKDSTRGEFNLQKFSKDLGITLDDLMIAIKQLVLEKIISIFQLQKADEVVIELLI